MDQEQRQLQHSPSVRDNLHQGSEVFSDMQESSTPTTMQFSLFIALHAEWRI